MITPPRATHGGGRVLRWLVSSAPGLDPFLKQAHFIERGQNVNGSWVAKCEPMASESGMAAQCWMRCPTFEAFRQRPSMTAT